MQPLIDSHSHFDAPEFDPDRIDVLRRAREAGVMRQVIPAITAASWPALHELCASHAGLHPAYGLHPMYLADHAPRHLDALAQFVVSHRTVAIGECGLDFHVEGLDGDSQRHYFNGQLELARALDLPVIVHARRALDDVIACLRRVGGLRGVVHSFSGSLQQARNLWALGFHIGIGGPVTYPRASRLRGIVAQMPLEFLLLETDSPDQPMASHRGERNEPAWLVDVLATVASLRAASEADIAAATTRNAEALFGL